MSLIQRDRTATSGNLDLYFIVCQLCRTCTKNSLEIGLQELSSAVPHGQSEQFSLKSIKEINIPAKIINPCQFGCFDS